ncbi:alpha/beta hydrolase family protein [Bowmanella pacifica]|uniref:Peptidase n=1 Tax=Bowmanella pacifica TaxID=502051 RepID=A0A917YT89_9ALTE|nr:prolyl oligopeptidase family serine peptidase [Bowmanella pacifica]GGO65561.1 peptidase [Bowmanella pacifica]
MLTKAAFALLLTLTPFFALAEQAIQSQHSCFKGPFETYQGWVMRMASTLKKFDQEVFSAYFPESKFQQVQQTLDCVDFVYQVDGFNVEGYYLKPKLAVDKKLPVVMFNRGGNGRGGYVTFTRKLTFQAELAAQGFIVIGSQYRGASKHIDNNGFDEFGGADVNDVVALMDIIKQIPDVDSENIAMMGWSRGSMQSYLAVKRLPNIKTLIAVAGVSDVHQGMAERPVMEKVYKKRIPDYENNKQQELDKRSVAKWAHELPANMPILLLHGDKDERVNVAHSTRLAGILESLEHPHKLVIYPGDNHGLTKHRQEMISEVVGWLNTYLH